MLQDGQFAARRNCIFYALFNHFYDFVASKTLQNGKIKLRNHSDEGPKIWQENNTGAI